MPAESRIVAAILRRLREAGAFAEKTHGSQYMRAGTPDIYACLNGYFIAIEVKQPGKKATPTQQRVLKEIQDAGGIAVVLDEASQVEWIIELVLQRARPS